VGIVLTTFVDTVFLTQYYAAADGAQGVSSYDDGSD